MDVLYSAKKTNKTTIIKTAIICPSVLFPTPAQGTHWSICLTKPRLFLESNSAVEKLYFCIFSYCVLETHKECSSAVLSSLQPFPQERGQIITSLSKTWALPSSNSLPWGVWRREITVVSERDGLTVWGGEGDVRIRIQQRCFSIQTQPVKNESFAFQHLISVFQKCHLGINLWTRLLLYFWRNPDIFMESCQGSSTALLFSSCWIEDENILDKTGNHSMHWG